MKVKTNTPPAVNSSQNDAKVLKRLAKGNDLEALLNHSANDLLVSPTLTNHLHVKELIDILSH